MKISIFLGGEKNQNNYNDSNNNNKTWFKPWFKPRLKPLGLNRANPAF